MSAQPNSNYHLDKTIIKDAIDLVSQTKPGNTEDFTGRYVLLILRELFKLEDWSIVPQYYTQGGDFPDLVVERYREKQHEPGQTRFLPRIFIELKSSVGDSTQNAIDQVLSAAKSERGADFQNEGFFITVRGLKWYIAEYNLIESDNRIISLPFQHEIKYPGSFSGEETRPKYVRGVGKTRQPNIESYTLDIKKDSKEIYDIIRWIAKKGHARKFSLRNEELPTCASESTMGSYNSGRILRETLERAIPLYTTPDVVEEIGRSEQLKEAFIIWADYFRKREQSAGGH